jgi:NADH-quinone oxidoreductase subunit M
MRILTVLAAMSIVVTAVYVLRGLGKVFLGKIEDPHFEGLGDAVLTEKLTTAILIAALAAIGIWPKLITSVIEPAIQPLIMRLGH